MAKNNSRKPESRFPEPEKEALRVEAEGLLALEVASKEAKTEVNKALIEIDELKRELDARGPKIPKNEIQSLQTEVRVLVERSQKLLKKLHAAERDRDGVEAEPKSESSSGQKEVAGFDILEPRPEEDTVQSQEETEETILEGIASAKDTLGKIQTHAGGWWNGTPLEEMWHTFSATREDIESHLEVNEETKNKVAALEKNCAALLDRAQVIGGAVEAVRLLEGRAGALRAKIVFDSPDDAFGRLERSVAQMQDLKTKGVYTMTPEQIRVEREAIEAEIEALEQATESVVPVLEAKEEVPVPTPAPGPPSIQTVTEEDREALKQAVSGITDFVGRIPPTGRPDISPPPVPEETAEEEPAIALTEMDIEKSSSDEAADIFTDLETWIPDERLAAARSTVIETIGADDVRPAKEAMITLFDAMPENQREEMAKATGYASFADFQTAWRGGLSEAFYAVTAFAVQKEFTRELESLAAFRNIEQGKGSAWNRIRHAAREYLPAIGAGIAASAGGVGTAVAAGAVVRRVFKRESTKMEEDRKQKEKEALKAKETEWFANAQKNIKERLKASADASSLLSRAHLSEVLRGASSAEASDPETLSRLLHARASSMVAETLSDRADAHEATDADREAALGALSEKLLAELDLRNHAAVDTLPEEFAEKLSSKGIVREMWESMKEGKVTEMWMNDPRLRKRVIGHAAAGIAGFATGSAIGMQKASMMLKALVRGGLGFASGAVAGGFKEQYESPDAKAKEVNALLRKLGKGNEELSASAREYVEQKMGKKKAATERVVSALKQGAIRGGIVAGAGLGIDFLRPVVGQMMEKMMASPDVTGTHAPERHIPTPTHTESAPVAAHEAPAAESDVSPIATEETGPEIHHVETYTLQKGDGITTALKDFKDSGLLPDMNDKEFWQWQKKELENMGFIIHGNTWYHPFEVHPGAKVELYTDTVGEPHVRVIGGEGQVEMFKTYQARSYHTPVAGEAPPIERPQVTGMPVLEKAGQWQWAGSAQSGGDQLAAYRQGDETIFVHPKTHLIYDAAGNRAGYFDGDIHRGGAPKEFAGPEHIPDIVPTAGGTEPPIAESVASDVVLRQYGFTDGPRADLAKTLMETRPIGDVTTTSVASGGGGEPLYRTTHIPVEKTLEEQHIKAFFTPEELRQESGLPAEALAKAGGGGAVPPQETPAPVDEEREAAAEHAPPRIAAQKNATTPPAEPTRAEPAERVAPEIAAEQMKTDAQREIGAMLSDMRREWIGMFERKGIVANGTAKDIEDRLLSRLDDAAQLNEIRLVADSDMAQALADGADRTEVKNTFERAVLSSLSKEEQDVFRLVRAPIDAIAQGETAAIVPKGESHAVRFYDSIQKADYLMYDPEKIFSVNRDTGWLVAEDVKTGETYRADIGLDDNGKVVVRPVREAMVETVGKPV